MGSVDMLLILNEGCKRDMLRPVCTRRSIHSASHKHISKEMESFLIRFLLFFLVYGLQGDLETLVLFPFWMLRKVCKCMCTELKADLMGSGELEPSDIPSDPWQP